MDSNSDDTKGLPIYLIGNTPLSYYLAYLFQKANKNPILIAAPDSKKESQPLIDLTFKEIRTAQKYKFSCPCEPYLNRQGEMIIITSAPENLTADLILLSPQKILTTPTLFFSYQKDCSSVERLLGKPLIRAYTNDYLQLSHQTVMIPEKEIKISIIKDFSNLKPCLDTLSFLHSCHIETQTSENGLKTFWEYFSKTGLGLVLSAYFQQKVSDILKNKKNRENVDNLIQEMIVAAQSDEIELDNKDLYQALSKIPNSYSFSTQKIDNKTIIFLQQIYKIWTTSLPDSKTKFPLLNKWMQEIYFRTNLF